MTRNDLRVFFPTGLAAVMAAVGARTLTPPPRHPVSGAWIFSHSLSALALACAIMLIWGVGVQSHRLILSASMMSAGVLSASAFYVAVHGRMFVAGGVLAGAAVMAATGWMVERSQ